MIRRVSNLMVGVGFGQEYAERRGSVVSAAGPQRYVHKADEHGHFDWRLHDSGQPFPDVTPNTPISASIASSKLLLAAVRAAVVFFSLDISMRSPRANEITRISPKSIGSGSLRLVRSPIGKRGAHWWYHAASGKMASW